MIKFKEENFLEIATGNMYDSICNAVYGLNRYTEKIYHSIADIYLDIDHLDNNQVKQIIRFLSSESENIIKFRAIGFVIDISHLLTRKYDTILSGIKKDENNHSYKISEMGYLYLDSFQNNIDWDQLKLNKYKFQHKSDDEELYNFNKYMEEEFEKYERCKFDISNKSFWANELFILLDAVFLKMNTTISHFKKLIEDSTSFHNTNLLCKKIISLIIILYSFLLSIDFDE